VVGLSPPRAAATDGRSDEIDEMRKTHGTVGGQTTDVVAHSIMTTLQGRVTKTRWNFCGMNFDKSELIPNGRDSRWEIETLKYIETPD